ncbi:MAG: beta-lactamase family protein [Lentisphaerae bacterium]|nr:beta-lactamase family protein [Lentisphaerota bacterium]
MKSVKGFIVVTAAMLFSVLAVAAPRPGKKCVVVGWEFIYTPPSEIVKHAEKYSGCGISGADFYLRGKLADGTQVSSHTIMADPKWTREAFAADIEALKKMSEMPEFSHSFVHAFRCPRKRIAWTDDAAWSRIAHNAGMAAGIAKESGMVGVSVDNEDYSSIKQFKRIDGDPEWREVKALARRRGREVFSAVFAAFPDAVTQWARFFSDKLWNYYYNAADPVALMESSQDLWPSFLNGVLDALPMTARIVEGEETGYRYEAEHKDCYVARLRNQTCFMPLLEPENRDKYRLRVDMAFPIYLDRYSTHKPGGRYFAGPVDGSRFVHFERNFADAFDASDSYMWLYGEQLAFARWERPASCKMPAKGKIVWEDKMPGLTDVLNASQHPMKFARERLAELRKSGKAVNIVPDRFPDGALPKPLQSWQAKVQPGIFGAKDGMLFAEGVGSGGLMTTIRDMREGDWYAVDFEVCGSAGETIVRFHRAGGAHDLTVPPTITLAPPEGDIDGWRRVTGLVRVPGGMDSMLVSAGMKQKPGERTLYRNFGIYRLMRFTSEVKAALQPYIDRGEIAGMVSILSDPQGNLTVDCLGWADVENRRKMAEDTLFAVFSMTKTFLGAAMMAAIDEGKISLDDKVSKYLPEFKNMKCAKGPLKRELTIRDLVCHVTGGRGGESVVARDIPLREIARRFAARSLAEQPGETFAYGNVWIDSAAAALEVAVGEPFEKWLERKILAPLGMKDTTFFPNDDQIKRLVKAYTTEGGPFRPAADGCVKQLEFPRKKQICPSAAGGLFSTPRDMIRFSRMLAGCGEFEGRQIISRKTFDGVFAVKQTPPNIKEKYTVGSWIEGDWFGHEGAMRTDQRANLKTGHARVFFIQTENKAGKAFFSAKRDWSAAADRMGLR